MLRLRVGYPTFRYGALVSMLTVPGMVSIDELSTGIGNGKGAVDDAASVVEAVKGQAEELVSTLQGHGVTGVADAISGVAQQLEEAQTALAGVGQKLDEAQQAAEAAKQGGLQGGGSAGPSPPAVQPASGIAGFNPKRRQPECVDAIRRAGYPTDADGKLKARGHFYDDEGTDKFGRTLRALPYGQTYDAPELREPWRSDTGTTTTWHIEGGIAAHMRRTGMKSGTLYLNAPTCGGEDRDPKRCYQNVAKTLPEGATLTVWSILESGEQRRVRFRGTGEAIQ